MDLNLLLHIAELVNALVTHGLFLRKYLGTTLEIMMALGLNMEIQ